jgi:thiol-disulfide isomerase/thioredoxin
MKRRPLAVLCAAIGIALAPPSRGVEVGVSIPECALAPLGDAPPPELARLRGEVLWIDFWASWCGPCAGSIPFLNALDAELGARGLRILGVNLDEDPRDAAEFLESHPARFALAADPTGECPRRFGVDAMPSAYLVDRRGVVRHVQRGFRARDTAALRRLVEALLAEGPAAAEPPGARDAAD